MWFLQSILRKSFWVWVLFLQFFLFEQKVVGDPIQIPKDVIDEETLPLPLEKDSFELLPSIGMAQGPPIIPDREENFMIPCSSYVTLRQTESEGVGYEHGYTTLEGLLFPMRTNRTLWPFFDLRIHRLDNNRWAANAGLCFRYLPFPRDYVFGFNVYYDYRRSDTNYHYHQIGAGLEFLSKIVDLRLNGYFPLKDEHILYTCVWDHYIGDYFIIRNRMEAALTGVSFEIGRFEKITEDIDAYAAIGAYYYGGDVCRRPLGVRGRLSLYIKRFFSLEGIITYDDIFKTRIQGEIALSIPFGCAPVTNFKNILTQPIERNEIIVVDEYCRWLWNY